jgi:hypothetical protein
VLGLAERHHVAALAAHGKVLQNLAAFGRRQKLLEISRQGVGIGVYLWLLAGGEPLA